MNFSPFTLVLLVWVGLAAAASPPINPCVDPNGVYCNGNGDNIIFRCANGTATIGNCNDNLAGDAPIGVNPASCIVVSPGVAACAKNCTAYPNSGNIGTTLIIPGCTPSSAIPVPSVSSSAIIPPSATGSVTTGTGGQSIATTTATGTITASGSASVGNATISASTTVSTTLTSGGGNSSASGTSASSGSSTTTTTFAHSNAGYHPQAGGFAGAVIGLLYALVL